MVSVWRTNAGPGPYILLNVVTSNGHIVAQHDDVECFFQCTQRHGGEGFHS